MSTVIPPNDPDANRPDPNDPTRQPRDPNAPVDPNAPDKSDEDVDKGDGPSSHETSGTFPADEVAATHEQNAPERSGE